MQDFIRIGGPIVSSPLNENFRRLLNAISMANVNLVFPDEDGITSTVTEMYDIADPVDGQVCYVISSGEFYRYSKGDGKWHKIMDIGQTFRQGFLNSGAVVLEGPMALKENTTNIINIPSMLVYFKNKQGDGRYLKGMYKIEAAELDVSSSVSGGNAYSIYTDEAGHFSIVAGMPVNDSVDTIYLGTFLTDSEGHIINDCVYTIPDIAYTADRGSFLLNGGQSSGMNLTPASNGGNLVARKEGYYYDEGINYAIGETGNFPIDTDNRADFNIRHYDGADPVDDLIYIVPDNGLNYDIDYTTGLVPDKYWNGSELVDVPAGYYTIQQHLVSPNGQDFIIYGSTLYNSMIDAVSNINSTFGIDIDFPYVEATRIAIGVPEGATFDVENQEHCRFYTMGRLAQVGTISPEFADNLFRIYSGDATDTTPSSIKFDLNALQAESFDSLYSMGILPSAVTRYKFGLDRKYITDANIENVTSTVSEVRSYTSGAGYQIADKKDIDDLVTRLSAVEVEIWNPSSAASERYNQSIRYRLFHLEDRVQVIENRLDQQDTKIDWLEKYKVYKNTSVNGYRLGDGTAKDEAKAIVLKTGDISEGNGLGSTTNLWFTQARVSQNSDVIASKNHRNTISASDAASGHTVVNPHNLSTDDIKLLSGTTRVFVTPEEERRIRSDRLPENTINELAKKLENIGIQTVQGDSSNPGAVTTLGNVTALKFYTSGANVTVDSSTGVAAIECIGQTDPSLLMPRSEFAINATSRPDLYGGAVDRALVADNVSVLDDAQPNQYYGTNDNNDKGMFDLPVYVSTMDAEDYTDTDQTTFEPIDSSVRLRHLGNSRLNYTNNDEESVLQTNVYDLVKNHYHKVFNSGSQGPYVEGTTTQDTSAIVYQYTVPAGGLSAGNYYFAYGNTNYRFAVSGTMAARSVYTYTPSTNILMVHPYGGSDSQVTITSVAPSAVDNTHFLNFVSKTDWNNINEWNFGNNLTVTVTDGRATINAAVAGSGATSFANLSDTDVTYNETNMGRMVVLGKDGSNNYKLQFAPAPALNNYMLIRDYVDSTIEKRVKRALLADTATVAESANTLQNSYTVNNATSSNTVLWTASKIIANTSSQIALEGVNTFYGTTEPTTVSGSKNGDIYIMIEE